MLTKFDSVIANIRSTTLRVGLSLTSVAPAGTSVFAFGWLLIALAWAKDQDEPRILLDGGPVVDERDVHIISFFRENGPCGIIEAANALAGEQMSSAEVRERIVFMQHNGTLSYAGKRPAEGRGRPINLFKLT